MRRAASLQRRLGLWLAVALALTWLIATVCAGVVIRHELDEAYNSALQETAQRLLPLAVADLVEREAERGPRRVPGMAEHDEFLTYLVRDRSGAVLMHSHDADLEDFPARPRPGFRDTATHRIYGERAVSGTMIIEVAEPLEHRREATLDATFALLTPLSLLLPLVVLGTWALVRFSLRPVVDLGREIEARGAGNLGPVRAEGLPRELGVIAEALNRLLDRLRRTLEAERNFASNSAHELRTPLAAALAQTQRLVAEAPEGELKRRAQQVEASLARLSRLSEKLLQLARAEGGGLLSQAPQRLAPPLEHLVDDLRRTPGAGDRLQLALPEEETHGAHIDPDAFAILMRNLIENALKHGDVDRSVRVAMSADGVVRVANAGGVVDPQTLARIGERFERGATRAPGVGLGLAIARRIAEGAGGSLELRSPAAGADDGFEAIVRLGPSPPPAPSGASRRGRR